MRYLLIILSCILLLSSTASAEEISWEPWQNLGEGVSVQRGQIGKVNQYTWRFHNDQPGTITRLEFQYEDNTGIHNKVIRNLRAGASQGGLRYFRSEGAPLINLVQVSRSSGK